MMPGGCWNRGSRGRTVMPSSEVTSVHLTKIAYYTLEGAWVAPSDFPSLSALRAYARANSYAVVWENQETLVFLWPVNSHHAPVVARLE
jgi:hypothetical protein